MSLITSTDGDLALRVWLSFLIADGGTCQSPPLELLPVALALALACSGAGDGLGDGDGLELISTGFFGSSPPHFAANEMCLCFRFVSGFLITLALSSPTLSS